MDELELIKTLIEQNKFEFAFLSKICRGRLLTMPEPLSYLEVA